MSAIRERIGALKARLGKRDAPDPERAERVARQRELREQAARDHQRKEQAGAGGFGGGPDFGGGGAVG